MSGDQFQYLGTNNQYGSFTYAPDWQDLTGSATTPGAGDSITINVFGADMFGDATLANISLTGRVTMEGSVTSGGLDISAGGGFLSRGAVTITGPAQIGAGVDIFALGGAFTEQGTLSADSGVVLSAESGGTIAIASLVSTGAGLAALSADSTSSIEIGSAIAATAGQIVIGAGQSVTLQPNGEVTSDTLINNGAIDSGAITTTTFINGGTVTSDSGPLSIVAYAAFTNTGTIAFADGSGQNFIGSAQITNNGSISIGDFLDLQGDVGGAGQFNIGAGDELYLEGSLGAGQAVALTGENATLRLGFDNYSSNYASAAGAITGFDGSDTLLLDQQVSSASWSNGVLSIFEGSTVVETLNLQGNFAGASWIAGYGDGAAGFVTLAGAAGDTSTAPAGASSGDAFSSTGNPGKVSWDNAANWYDNTVGANAVVAPGAKDSVEFDGTSASQIVTGVGQAATLIDNNDNLILAGNFTFGSATLNSGLEIAAGQVTVGTISGGGAISMESGGRFTTAGDFSNTVTLNGGSMVVGGTFSLANFGQGANVGGGGSLQVGGLALASFFVNVDVDSTASMEVGAGGHVLAGEFLIDAGAAVTSTGWDAIDAAQLENDGTITSNSNLTFYISNGVNTGTITGALSIDADSLTNSGQIFATNVSLNTTTLQNNGLMASTGSLSINGAITGTGEIDIDSTTGGAASVAFNDDVAAGQIIKMTGAASSLQQNTGSTIEAAITGFGVGDTLQVATAVTSATWAGGALSLFNGSILVETLNIGAGYGAAHFAVAYDGAISTITTDSNAALGQTYTLTKKADSFTGPATDDLFIAAVGTLTAKDVIDGGGGINTLELTGSGQFNLATPKTLTNIQVLDVFENVKGSLQNVHLRDGLTLTVNVADATFVPAVTAANRISRAHDLVQAGGGDETTGARLFGANYSTVFNLGGGLDIVTLGSATEVVNGKGDALIKSAAAFAGARITGGGVTVLDLKTGGTAVMNAADTGVTLVSLDNTTSAYAFTANAEAGLVIEDDNNHGGDVITAGGAGQTLTGGGAGVTLIAAASGGDLFQNTIANFNGELIGGFASAGNVIDVTNLVSTKIKTATFVENAAGTAGTLTLAANGQKVAISLFGQFMAAGFSGTAAQAGFTIGSDGANGTNVTYHPVIAAGH